MRPKWYKAKVVRGRGVGKKLGFPTLNLTIPQRLSCQREGVYVTQLKIKKGVYYGLLYYGPRLILGEKENILEIFVFNFKEEIYGEIVSFQPLDYLRPVKKFGGDFEAFKKQLSSDFRKAKKIIANTSKL